MPISDAASRAGGMLSDLKSRLGFSHEEDNYENYDDREYQDPFDDEYDDGYDDGYEEPSRNSYGSDYRNRPSSGYVPATAHTSRFGRADSTPDLVSIDDVKAHTQVPDSLMRDPLAKGETYEYRRGRSLVQNTGPAESSPAYNAAKRERENARNSQSRAEGLDALFEPSSSASASRSSSYDPYEAYSGSTPTASYSGSRSLTVIRPITYGDVERIARALKAGDVVVLAMRNTPDDLSKRVLDFSFGVASALDANVECPSSKVFAIARGRALSEDEKRSLRSQGVL